MYIAVTVQALAVQLFYGMLSYDTQLIFVFVTDYSPE